MNIFPNLKVGVKLGGGFFVLIAIVIFLAVTAYWGITYAQESTKNVYVENQASVTEMSNALAKIYYLRGSMFKYSLIPAGDRAPLSAEIDGISQAIDQNIAALEAVKWSAEIQAQIVQLKTDWVNYRNMLQQARDQLEVSPDSDVNIVFAAAEQATNALDQSATTLFEMLQKDAAEKLAQQERGLRSNMTVLAVIVLVAVVFSVFVAVTLTSGIVGPLQKSIVLLKEIGQGHLDERLPVNRKDELGDLILNMNQFADDLQSNVVEAMKKIARGDLSMTVEVRDERDQIGPALQQTVSALRGLETETSKLINAAAEGQITIRGDETQFQGGYRKIVEGFNNTLDLISAPLKLIVEAANSLSATASELQVTTTQQAAGASEQSAAIAQTTTTVDEVKVIGEQAVLRSQEVYDTSTRTMEVSRSGQQTLNEMIDSMNRIRDRVEGIAENILALSEQTQQIGEIIATVSGIAAQSNMLALNASVEAARAGEHGKGFAVVAVEVRNLAEQSRQATAQVKAILQDIQKATNATVMATEEGTKVVEQGVKLAARTQEALEQLSGVINESSERASQVVAGGRQQASGIEQIALAMQNINQATLQNMAATRQAEHSAHLLNDLARRMAEETKKYKV